MTPLVVENEPPDTFLRRKMTGGRFSMGVVIRRYTGPKALVHAEMSLDKSKLIHLANKVIKGTYVVCSNSLKHMIVCANKVIMRPLVQVNGDDVTQSQHSHINWIIR